MTATEWIWAQTSAALREAIGASAFDAWIRPLAAKVERGRLVLAAPSGFFLQELRARFEPAIREALARVADEELQLEFRVDPKLAEKAQKEEEAAQSWPGRVDGHIDPRLSFENFVVGEGNRFCHAACEAVSKNPGTAYNPLYIYGGVGLGKTHLLNAVALRIVQTKPLRVVYRTGEAFTNELIEAIRGQSVESFRERYRQVDVLIVDDIQFIEGKERTQEEFFHTFNELRTAGKQIVLASDRSPTEFRAIAERLRSRFNSGLVADIQPPDYETRLAILHCKARIAEVELPQEVAELIASRITSNVREMEGALTRLTAHATLTGEPITLEIARRVLRDMLKEREKPITTEEIQKAVADFYGVHVREMRSGKRARAVAFPRQIAMYLAKRLTTLSLPEIGQEFGGRHHTTVLHAVQKVEAMRQEDPELDEDLRRLEARLRR